MKVRDVIEMLGRLDGDLKLTIGGVEYEDSPRRIDRNGRVSMEVCPAMKTEIQRLEAELDMSIAEYKTLDRLRDKLVVELENLKADMAK
jgi:hypothetical protein